MRSLFECLWAILNTLPDDGWSTDECLLALVWPEEAWCMSQTPLLEVQSSPWWRGQVDYGRLDLAAENAFKQVEIMVKTMSPAGRSKRKRVKGARKVEGLSARMRHTQHAIKEEGRVTDSAQLFIPNPLEPPSTPQRLGGNAGKGGLQRPEKPKKVWRLPSRSSQRSPTSKMST